MTTLVARHWGPVRQDPNPYGTVYTIEDADGRCLHKYVTLTPKKTTTTTAETMLMLMLMLLMMLLLMMMMDDDGDDGDDDDDDDDDDEPEVGHS